MSKSLRGLLFISDSIYTVIEIAGSTSVSWEGAAKNVIDKANQNLKDLRVA